MCYGKGTFSLGCAYFIVSLNCLSMLYFSIFAFIIYLGMCITWHVRRGQRTRRRWLSPSIMWDPGIELRMSGLTGVVCTC